MIRPREELRYSDHGMSYQREPDWRNEARCLGLDVADFVPEGKGHTVPAAVLRICGACPVIQQCLDFAIETNDTDAFLGGTSPRERRGMTIGTRPPLLDHLCECGEPILQRKAKTCRKCKAAKHAERQRARDGLRRAANRERVAS